MTLPTISILGTGYVGAVTGACLADLGHHIVFVGRNRKKLDMIELGQSPIFEPGLDHLLEKNTDRISTTTDIGEAIQNSTITFICVGTPSHVDGSIDLGQVQQVALDIGRCLCAASPDHLIVVKSTVLPGTTESVVIPLLEKISKKKGSVDFHVASNPEFLKEGSAIEDFFHADRVVIGANNPKARNLLEDLYRPLSTPLFSTTIKAAEMIKYASNAFLATKISFANEVGNICKRMNLDSYEVFKGVGMDSRIGSHFFRSGIGFGGSCFPKDVRALISHARSLGIEPKILSAVMETNEEQPARMIDLLKKHLDLPGKTIGILGLAFKPDSDDVRESRAIPVIQALHREGAEVIAFDPVAMDNFRQLFPHIMYTKSASEVLFADAIVILTEWEEFEEIDYTGKIVIDGRRIRKARDEAAIYEGICW